VTSRTTHRHVVSDH